MTFGHPSANSDILYVINYEINLFTFLLLTYIIVYQ